MVSQSPDSEAQPTTRGYAWACPDTLCASLPRQPFPSAQDACQAGLTHKKRQGCRGLITTAPVVKMNGRWVWTEDISPSRPTGTLACSAIDWAGATESRGTIQPPVQEPAPAPAPAPAQPVPLCPHGNVLEWSVDAPEGTHYTADPCGCDLVTEDPPAEPVPSPGRRGTRHCCEPETDDLLAGQLWDVPDPSEDDPTVTEFLGAAADRIPGWDALMVRAAASAAANDPFQVDGAGIIQEAVDLAVTAGFDVYDSDTRTWVYYTPVTCVDCPCAEAAEPARATDRRTDDDDTTDTCPRCGKTLAVWWQEGGADSPLCDDCWARTDPATHGYWAGRMGWGTDGTSSDDPEAFTRGARRGQADAALLADPSTVPDLEDVTLALSVVRVLMEALEAATDGYSDSEAWQDGRAYLGVA